MSELNVQEYKKRVNTVKAVQWDGSLSTVQDVIAWVLEQDPNASVTANFTSAGIRLSIVTQGQQLYAGAGDFILHSDEFGLSTMSEVDFNRLYEVV